MATRPLLRVSIVPGALDALLGAWREARYEEPCGVLLGRWDGDGVRIEDAPRVPNAHPDPERAFWIPPEAVLDAVRAGRDRGLCLVGFWHGHLTGPPDPGHADLDGLAAAEELAGLPRLLVLVGRGTGRAPVVRAWARGGRGPYEVPLSV
jgi:proteasome lid subunit RPN8/RPN11